MKKRSQQELLAYCYRADAYQKKIPGVTWVEIFQGVSNFTIAMEEFRSLTSSFCIYPIKLRDLPRYSTNNLILSLDDHFSKNELSHYFPLAVDMCKIDGKLMSIPEDFSPYVLFSRRDLLDQYGLESPKDLKELQKQLSFLKQKTGKAVFHVDGGGIYARLGFITSIIGSFGIDLNGSLETWSKNPDALVEAYEWIRHLHQQQLITGLDLFVRLLNPVHINNRIAHLKGDIVFYPHWLSKQNLLLGPDHFKKIEMTLLPPAHRGIDLCQPLSGHGWVIPSNTDDPLAAVKILKKTQTRELIRGNEIQGGFPFVAWRDLWKDPEIIQRHPFDRWDKILGGLKRGCLLSTSIRKFELLDQSFRHSIRQNLNGKAWLRTLLTNEFSTSRKLTTDAVIKQAVDYMERNLGKIKNTQQVASHVSMSPNYFSQYFQKKMKIGCGAYLTRIRMERAQQLLRAGKSSIKTIAAELGFKHPQTFTRAFRKYTGNSPSELSRQH